MKILGIDYGRKKIGLAISEGKLAEPLCVIRYSDTRILSERIRKIVESESIQKVVVGISEGEMAREQGEFVKVMSHKLSVKVETLDETLTTKEAQRLSIEAGMKRKKRKDFEDAYAAAIILQKYLDA